MGRARVLIDADVTARGRGVGQAVAAVDSRKAGSGAHREADFPLHCGVGREADELEDVARGGGAGRLVEAGKHELQRLTRLDLAGHVTGVAKDIKVGKVANADAEGEAGSFDYLY